MKQEAEAPVEATSMAACVGSLLTSSDRSLLHAAIVTLYPPAHRTWARAGTGGTKNAPMVATPMHATPSSHAGFCVWHTPIRSPVDTLA